MRRLFEAVTLVAHLPVSSKEHALIPEPTADRLRESSRVVVIGAGPSGLTAAYELAKNGVMPVLVEAAPFVGGISRTEERDGYRFDLGGHRFFSKSEEVEGLWDEMAGEPLLVRDRLSRIFYEGKFYNYPLRATNALWNAGPVNALRIVVSYVAARLDPSKEERSFEQWVVNRFGRRLYEMFFKAYTEKVWGVPCSELSAEWAAHRIRSLSLWKVVLNAFGLGGQVTTLIHSFRYPRLGPGQLWESCAAKCVEMGVDLRLDERVVGIDVEDGRVCAVRTTDSEGRKHVISAEHVISSMPLPDLVEALGNAPKKVAKRASSLRFRGFVMVAVVFDRPGLFPDNWVYVHSPEVLVGRVQNFGNWSPDMLPDAGLSCLGMEYFADPGDDVWTSSDEYLVTLAAAEVRQIGLVKQGDPVRGWVVRVPRAYPVYEQDNAEYLKPVVKWLRSVGGLQCVGRNGQHRYNNMDHSMMTALLAARNVIDGGHRDVWGVNADAEYHEESSAPAKDGAAAA